MADNNFPSLDALKYYASLPRRAIEGGLSSMADLVAKPGQYITPNPYPPGSEEADWYENQRLKGGESWAREAALSTMGTGAIAGVPMRAGEAALGSGAIRPLAIRDAVEADPVAEGMVRLYRGGGNNPGGPKWVTTSRKYAEGYTTPGLAHSPRAGSYLQYADVPATNPLVAMPAGQSVHSFEAPVDIADLLKPFYRPK